MTDVTSDRGRFVWYDLMTTDPAKAVDFYTKVVGWGTEAWQSAPGAHAYTMWKVQDGPIGGLMTLPAQAAERGAPPHWIAYVCVPNVDDTVAQITAKGGKILNPPTDIPTVGRFAVFADPQGAVLAVFTPAGNTPGHTGQPRLGDMAWHELVARDADKAFDFYSSLFGWERTSDLDMGEMGKYQMYGRNGVSLGGMFNVPPSMPMPPHWMYYISVDDVDDAVKRVTQHGGTVTNGPMDVPGGGRIAQCMDPQGAAFAMHSGTMST